MANKSLLTNGFKVFNVEQNFYGPSAVLKNSPTEDLYSIYSFLSSVLPWEDDDNPPDPIESEKYIKQTLKNMFVAKKITSNDISPVVQRIDWSSGTIYDYYKDDINLFQFDTNGYLILKFYIKNRYDQIFKCLWNNNSSESTDEPSFAPGSYGQNNIYIGSDGYKWKYMYTLDLGQKIKFMDDNWIPISSSIDKPNPLTTSAGYGNIDVINVTNTGSGYDTQNSIISVIITGDGTGANGTAVVANGQITDIIVTNTGTNYTYANVSIISELGSNASAIVSVSPIGGHAHDPITELGCNHVMFVSEFNSDENNIIPTDITYHQIGIVMHPTSKSSSPKSANGSIYKTTTDIVVASGFDQYSSGETVYQGPSLQNATFMATVLSFDVGSNLIRLINTTGTITLNAGLFGNNTQTVRTVLYYTTPIYEPLSGYVSYIENRSSIQRSPDGIEQFKLVVKY
jgi:hypothetical protein